MKFSYFIFILFGLTLTLSCTDENKLVDDVQIDNVTNKSDFDDLNLTPFPINVRESVELKNSMIDFVNNVKLYYEENMTYSEFKFALDPENGLSEIKPEGESLLNQAYIYIVNNTRDENIESQKLLEALVASFSYNEEINQMDFNDITNEHLNIVSKELFGLDKNYDDNFNFKGGCKWYEVWCHASWLVDVIATWWNTDAPGDGGMTNGQILTGAVAVISGVLGIVIIVF